MKPYTVEIDIDLPRDRVIELFDNPDNLQHWQNGFQSFEHLSGEPGKPGAKSKLIYQNGKHRIELIETITKNELPESFDGSYDWGHGSNTLVNEFIEVGPNRTKWKSTCSYEFRGLMLKAMGFFFPGKFKEQNMMFLKNFKAFAEHGNSVKGVE